EEENEARRDTAHNQPYRAATTRRAKREGRGEQYHGEEQERPGDAAMPKQKGPWRGKTRGVPRAEENRQNPERDGLGRAEAVLDTLPRHIGGQLVFGREV